MSKVPKYIQEAMNNAQLASIKHRNASQVVVNWLEQNNFDIEEPNLEEKLADTLDYGLGDISILVEYIEQYKG